MILTTTLRTVIEKFQFVGRLLDCVPYGTGHIHRTYRLSFQDGDCLRGYILQQLNQRVFPAPEQLMENMVAVTAHLQAKVRTQDLHPARQVLTLVGTWDGSYWYRTPQGDYWRATVLIKGASAYLQAPDPAYFYQAGRALGEFQGYLSDFPLERLHVTIPDFHHTPKRFQAFRDALAQDPCRRASQARAELDFALQRANEAGRWVPLLTAGVMPERVTHNDAKLDNILIDDDTGKAVCVIDLDTVMPGLAVFDFGDLVRSCCNPALEDEPDLGRVTFQLPTFALLAQGFLDAAHTFLTPIEIDHLAFGARLITFEQGLRFLTDYLLGDIYYPTGHPTHNLERARTQFKLVQDMEAVYTDMQALVRNIAKR